MNSFEIARKRAEGIKFSSNEERMEWILAEMKTIDCDENHN